MISESERSSIVTACHQLLARYAVAVDNLDWDALLSLFSADLHWERPGMAPMRSHAEVRARFEALTNARKVANPHGHLTRHMFTTVSIDVGDSERATGVSYALVYRDVRYSATLPSPMPQGPELIVEYRDVFGRTEAGWRIVRHEARHIFRADFYRSP